MKKIIFSFIALCFITICNLSIGKVNTTSELIMPTDTATIKWQPGGGDIWLHYYDIHDVDRNGIVDVFDLSALQDAWHSNSTDPIYDVDQNGTIDIFDISSFLDCWYSEDGCGVFVAE